MADDLEIKFTGINTLQSKLEALRAKYPFKEEEILQLLGKRLKKSAQTKTPLGKSRKHLRSQYKLSKVNYDSKGANITMTNPSPLFHLVENGHVIKNKKDGEELGFVQGLHMVETSMIELDTEMTGIVGAWLDEVLGEET